MIRSAAMLTLLLACGANDARTPIVAPSEAPCATERARLDALLREGRIERLAQATSDRPACRELEPIARAMHDKALAELETSDPEGDLRRAIELRKSDPVASRRAFDRASRGLEKTAGRPFTVETTSLGNASTLPSAVFSDDARWVAGIVSSRTLVVEAATARPVLELECDDYAHAAFGDGFVVVMSCFGAVEDRPRYAAEMPPLAIFALPEGKPIAAPKPAVLAMAVSKSLVALADATDVTLFDVAKRSVVWKSPWTKPDANGTRPLLAFDAAGARLAVRDPERRLSILAVTDGHRMQSLGETRGEKLFFAPDGSLVETVGGTEVASWNLATSKRTPLKGVDWAENVSFSGDGKSAAVWSTMWTGAKAYDFPSWKARTSQPFANGHVAQVLATHDGFRVLASTDAGIEIADLTGNAPPIAITKKPTHRFGGALSPDGTKWAVIDGDEWDDGPPLRVGEVGGASRSHPMMLHPFDVRAVALSDDRTLLALGRRDGIDLVQLPSGRVGSRIPNEGGRLRFSPAHDALAIAGPMAVTVVDVATGTKRFSVDAYDAFVAFDARGARVAITPAAGPLVVVDALTGRKLAAIDVSPTFQYRIEDLGFSDAGTLIAGETGATWSLDIAQRAWIPSTVQALDAAVPARRCKTFDGKTAREAFTLIPDTVTADCAVALVRDRDTGIRVLSFPQLETGILIQLVEGRSEMFARPMVAGRETFPVHYASQHVQLVGAHARELVTCRLGPRVLPIELCDERFFDDGVLAAFFRH